MVIDLIGQNQPATIRSERKAVSMINAAVGREAAIQKRTMQVGREQHAGGLKAIN